MSKKLFISHSTIDDAVADLIHDGLRAAGFDEVWVDHRHGIEPGDQDWELAIREALGECEVVLFLMSQNSLESKWCKREISRADGLGKPIFVAKSEEIQGSNDRFMQIETSQYTSFMTRSDEEMQIIIRALKGEHAPDLPKPVTAQTITGVDTMHRHLEYLKNPLRGREDDLEKIHSQLFTTPMAVVQLTGIGGVGKSRLASEIALDHPTGAIWHRCSENSQAAELLELAREHVKLPDAAKPSDILARLAEICPLIVIDNAEDALVDSERHKGYRDLLSEIIGRGVPVLMTSRAAWDDLAPRHSYQILPLKELDAAKQLALDFAKANEVSITDGDAAKLAQKARLHPRLLEFAVRQLHNDETDLNIILRRLDELKDYTIQDALNEMIRRTIDQMAKHAKHGDDAKALLSNATILKGFFPETALKAVAPENLREEDTFLHARATLQKWQFLRRDIVTKRFTLGELVPEAVGVTESEAVFKAYAFYFTHRAGEIFNTPLKERQDWKEDLLNIFALGDMLVSRMPTPIPPFNVQTDFEKGLLGTAFLFALFVKDFVAERADYRRLAWLQMGLNIAQAHGGMREQTVFLSTLGKLLSSVGKNKDALAYFEQALVIHLTAGDLKAAASALSNIAMMRATFGEHKEALELLQEALGIHTDFGNKEGSANTLNNIGFIYSALNEKRTAIEYFERALTIFREINDLDDIAITLANIGFAWNELGEQKTALIFLEEALPLCRDNGNERTEAMILNNLAGVAIYSNDKLKALDLFGDALKKCVSIGDTYNSVLILRNISMLFRDLGQLDMAIEFLERAVRIGRLGQHPDLERCQYSLELLQLQHDYGLSAEEAFNTHIVNVYRNRGEAELRSYMRKNGAPNDRFEEIVADVKRAAAQG